MQILRPYHQMQAHCMEVHRNLLSANLYGMSRHTYVLSIFSFLLRSGIDFIYCFFFHKSRSERDNTPDADEVQIYANINFEMDDGMNFAAF